MSNSPEYERVLALRRRLRGIFLIELCAFFAFIVGMAVGYELSPQWRTTVCTVCLVGILLDLLAAILTVIFYGEVRKSWNILRARGCVQEAAVDREKRQRDIPTHTDKAPKK